MRGDIYSRLPPPARRLVDQIEQKSGIEIQVSSRAERTDGEIAEIDEGVVGVIVGPDSITIESPADISAITNEDFIHELLHLQRMYVVNVPHLYPRKATNGGAAAAIDNWLEHIIIYEQQIKMCEGFKQKLDSQLAEFWPNRPWGVLGPMLKFNLITRYMVTHLYGERLAKQSMKEAIEFLKLDYRIRDAARRCLKVVSDKRNFTKEVLQFCEIRSEIFWLRRYDLKERKFVWFSF